jgi:hypothetical protein
MPNAEDTAERVEDFYVRLLTRGAAQKVEVGAPENDPVAYIIATIADSVLAFARPAFRGSEIAPLLEGDRLLVRTIPPAGVQAVTVWAAPRHAVAVNRGLALFLYRLARAFAAHVIVRGPEDPPAPPESEAAGIIATLLDWMASPVRAPLVEDWPLGPREQKTAENFTTAAERFVLAHEIAHILHRHLIADSAKVNVALMSPLELDTRPVEQEIAADVTATCLTIESMDNDDIDPRAGVVGMHFFLQSLGLAEKLGAVVVDDAHPPAEERLDVCHWAILQRYGPDANALGEWAQQTDELVARLASEALAERDRRRTAATARIDEVLRTTSWSVHRRDPARDKALLEEALSLMSKAPSAIMAAIDANLLAPEAYTQLVSAASSPSELEQNGAWRRHQVAHFIARNSPPQVKQALGVWL